MAEQGRARMGALFWDAKKSDKELGVSLLEFMDFAAVHEVEPPVE